MTHKSCPKPCNPLALLTGYFVIDFRTVFMKERNPRILLARLRSGDYAHPGDTEAIDIFLEYLLRFQHPKFERILDVGSGRGATAEYVRQKLSPLLINGVDIDTKAIQYATDKYPDVKFDNCDVNEIEKLSEHKFDLIYFFSVLYAFESSLQQSIFHKLASVAKPGTIIAINDYIVLNEDLEPILDFSNKVMRPPVINDLKSWLTQAGWDTIGELYLWDEYKLWYENFLQKLESLHSNLILEFEIETINIVKNTFQTILNKINNKTWSGAIIYAQFQSQAFFQNEPDSCDNLLSENARTY